MLNDLYESMNISNATALGYPSSKDVFPPELLPFLELPINNIGDPYTSGVYRLQTRRFEREVVDIFADLLRAPTGDYWGYITTGGTEGNLHSLYVARELYPNGIVYYSEHTHYSLKKSLRILNIPHIMIRAQRNGEIDYEDLRETLRIRRDATPIIFANVGTTMTEARDDVGCIVQILDDLGIESRYIHSDAALCGAYAPFLEPRPSFDFADGADSITISGHKFLGCVLPCGIVIARKANVRRIAHAVDYIDSPDTTIAGSRSGVAPLVLWRQMKSLGADGLRRRIGSALDIATYAERRLISAGIDAWRNHNAITVVFPKLPAHISRKWQLPASGSLSHIITMRGITKDHIDAFVSEVLQAARGISCVN